MELNETFIQDASVATKLGSPVCVWQVQGNNITLVLSSGQRLVTTLKRCGIPKDKAIAAMNKYADKIGDMLSEEWTVLAKYRVASREAVNANNEQVQLS